MKPLVCEHVRSTTYQLHVETYFIIFECHHYIDWALSSHCLDVVARIFSESYLQETHSTPYLNFHLLLELYHRRHDQVCGLSLYSLSCHSCFSLVTGVFVHMLRFLNFVNF